MTIAAHRSLRSPMGLPALAAVLVGCAAPTPPVQVGPAGGSRPTPQGGGQGGSPSGSPSGNQVGNQIGNQSGADGPWSNSGLPPGGAGSRSGWSSKARSAGGAGGAQLSPSPTPFVVPVGGVVRENAKALLRQAIESPQPLLRANAIEAVAGEGRVGDKALAQELLQRGLADTNRGVRFVSAMNVGLVPVCEETMLVEPLLHDEHASVRAAAIYALMRCGRQVDPTPLAAMLASDDPEIRGNAALVLGELGNPTALPMLRQVAGKGMDAVNPARVRIVELQLAEAQFKLGDRSAADPIRAALFAPPQQSEFAALACQVCGRVEDQGAVAALERLIDASGEDERPPEVRLAAASALGRMRPPRPQDIDLAEALLQSELPQARAQAAITLARMDQRRSLPAIQPLLSDTDPGVQVAAAGAILRLSAGD